MCDVVPVPVQRPVVYNYITSSFSREEEGKSDRSNSQVIDKASCVLAGRMFVDRDDGIFDNLPFVWKREGESNPRKQIYSFLTGGEGRTNYIIKALYV